MGDGVTLSAFLRSDKAITVELIDHLNTELKWNMVNAFNVYAQNHSKSHLIVRPSDVVQSIGARAQHGRQYDFIWIDQNAIADDHWRACLEHAYSMLMVGGTMLIHGVGMSLANTSRWNAECTKAVHAFSATLHYKDHARWRATTSGDGVMEIVRTL